MTLNSLFFRGTSERTIPPLCETVRASAGCLLLHISLRVPAVCQVCLEADIRVHHRVEASYLEHNEKRALTYLANISLPSPAAAPHPQCQWPGGIKQEISRESSHCRESLSQINFQPCFKRLDEEPNATCRIAALGATEWR